MARTDKSARPPRNTAPLWKKVAVVLSAPVAMLAVISLLNANEWGFIPFALVAVAAGVLAVWVAAKLLGVHLSLRSWD